MRLFNTVAIMSNGFKIRVNHKSDTLNIRLFAGYAADEIIDLSSKTRK